MLDDIQPVSLSPTLIVEDDPAMRFRLCHVLGTLGCDERRIATAQTLAQARAALLQTRFGVALVDIGLPDGSGIELIRWMHAHCPHVPAVVISAWRTEEVILSALRAGAIGYLLKERDDLEIGLALRSIEQGGAPIDPVIARRILTLIAQSGKTQAAEEATPALQPVPAPAPQAPAPDTPAPTLSRREQEILRLVAQGLSNREMAEMLSISRLTVECHTKNIYRKLVVGSRTEAVFQARRHGLLS